MSEPALAAFRSVVLRDESLQAALRRETDRGAFISLVVRVAAEHGHEVTASDVESALAAARRAWLERWI